MKKITLVLVVIVIAFLGFYTWATSGAFNSDTDRYVIYDAKESGPIQKDTISIMTFNIGYLSGMTNNKAIERSKALFDTNAESLIQLLDKESIDILAMQEIDFGSSRSFDVDQFDFLLKEGKFNYGAKALNWDKNYVPFPNWPLHLQFGKVQSGQAVISKFPVLTNTVEILEKPVDQPFYYNDFYLDRLMQTTTLSLNGQEVTVINIHLEAFSEKTRALHLKHVFEAFRKEAEKGPSILLGDFNESVFPLESSLMSPFYKSHNFKGAIALDSLSVSKQDHFTYSAESPEVKIDYIFYSSAHIEMLEAKTISETQLLSDHLPVMMRFRLKKVNENLSVR